MFPLESAAQCKCDTGFSLDTHNVTGSRITITETAHASFICALSNKDFRPVPRLFWGSPESIFIKFGERIRCRL